MAVIRGASDSAIPVNELPPLCGEVVKESFEELLNGAVTLGQFAANEMKRGVRGEELQTKKAIALLAVFMGEETARLVLREETLTSHYAKQLASEFDNLDKKERFKALAKLAISFIPIAGAAKPAQTAKVVQSAKTVTAAKGASRYPLRSKNQQMAETVVTNKATTAEKVVETAKVDKSKTFTPQYALNAKNVNKTAEARVANPKLGVTIADQLTRAEVRELLKVNSYGLPEAQIKGVMKNLGSGTC